MKGDSGGPSLHLRKGWDEAAPRYKDRFGPHLEEISHRLASLLSPPLMPPILDLACGPGTAMKKVFQRHGSGPFIGCDFSFRMAGFARSAITLGHGVVADQDRLPFAPGSLGTVVSSMGTIFSKDPGRQMAHLGSLLRPGGQFAFSAWGPKEETSLGEVSRTIAEQWPYPLPEDIPSLVTPFSSGLTAWLEETADVAGFRIRTVESHWLLFRFPDLSAAASALLGTGRFHLLLAENKDREPELFERTQDAFLPYLNPRTSQVELSNRYHLFVLVRKEGDFPVPKAPFDPILASR